jgi:hypothetical protein
VDDSTRLRREQDKAAQWEACFTHHYLRSDGPFGDGPITFIDATPAEIRDAAGRDEWSEEAARLSFLSSISAAEARSWLGGRVVQASDSATPGYLRYLVLTCYVVATDDELSDTHDFRLRLAHVLGTEAAFQSVSGVNRLWESLARWCERRRNAGDPIRRLVLPDPGNMVLIGHAVKLAFPSWRDRAAFARLLAEIPTRVRRNPLRLTDELMRPHRWWAIPAAIQEVCRDFAARLARRDRMLLSHRFWSLVASIDTSLTDQASARTMQWILEASFGGYEGDELHLRLCVDETARRCRPTDEGQWSDVALAELVSGKAQAIPTSLASAMQAGAIPLTERGGGRWTFEGHFPPPDDSIVLLASAELYAQLGDVGQPWISFGAGWRGSARLSKAEIDIVRARLHGIVEDDPSETLVDLRIEGGVRTGRSSYLGRPGFLPRLHASDSATIRVEPSGVVDGVLSAVGVAPHWALSSKTPISGRWELTATEGGLDHETIITLEADAPEREFAQTDQPDTRFEPELEIRVDEARPIAPSRKVSRASPSIPSTELDDLLEAVYTASPQGWSEAELVPLVQAVLPDPRMVWDVLRSLAEAGWIDPCISTSWRARKWRPRRPGLIEISPHCALVDGAVGARSRRRLTSAASTCGGELEVRNGISQFAPSTVVVHGASCGALAAECGWPLSAATRPVLRAAPDCWTADLRTIEGRSLAGIWSFELGFFQTDTATAGRADGIAIERWRRERGDDRDVYRVRGGGPELFLSSRTAAILEGVRRARRGLFRWSDGRLWRATRGGYLPLTVARALRCKSLVSAGPVLLDDKAWSYGYAAELVDAQWLAAVFGPAVEVPIEPHAIAWMQPGIRARRMGFRPMPAELFGQEMGIPADRDPT